MDIPMKIISAKEIKHLGVFSINLDGYFNSEESMTGNTNFTCGNCERILLKNITRFNAAQSFDIPLKCPKCNKYNVIDKEEFNK